MSETPQAYPLSWPSYVPRTAESNRSRATFRSQRANTYAGPKTMADAIKALQYEMDRLLGANRMVLSTNVVLRLDGFPRADQAKPKDPGAALYFNRDGKPLCMPCDRWDRVEDNVYAIAKHIEAMRGMERWGVGTTEQAFAGYKALPEGEKWWDVLDLAPGQRNAEMVRSKYRSLAMQVHQSGAGDAAMVRLNIARDEALIELGVKEP